MRQISRQDWLVGVLLVVILLALYLPVYRTGAWGVKEGFCLYGSLLTAEGKVPYRDFDSFYAPLTTYLHALMFIIGGVSIDRARLLIVIMLVLNAIVIYILSRRLLPPFQAGLISLMGVAFYQLPPHNYVTLYATLFALLTLAILAHALESSYTPAMGLFVGIGTGLTAVTHHPIAVFLALTVIGSVAFASFLPMGEDRIYSLRDSILFIITFGLGCAGVALPVYGAFASLISWDTLLHQLMPPQVAGEIGQPFPSLTYLIPRSLSGEALYPFSKAVFFWVTLTLVALTTLFLINLPTEAPFSFLIPLTIFQCLMESKNITLGNPNLLYCQAAFVLAGYWGFQAVYDETQERHPWRTFIVWGLCAGFLLLEVGSWATQKFIGRAKPTYRVTAGQNTLFMSTALGESTQTIIDFLETNTTPSDSVAIFPDGILVSLFTGRPNPFRTTVIDSGLSRFRDPKAQDELMKTIEKDKVPLIVALEWSEGYLLRFSFNEVPILTAYLKEHYTHIKDLGAKRPPLLSFIAHVYKRRNP